jgi:hypothetical protein
MIPPNLVHGRPCFDETSWHQRITPQKDVTEFAAGWRRAHALASLRACLGVLAFVSAWGYYAAAQRTSDAWMQRALYLSR